MRMPADSETWSGRRPHAAHSLPRDSRALTLRRWVPGRQAALATPPDQAISCGHGRRAGGTRLWGLVPAHARGSSIPAWRPAAAPVPGGHGPPRAESRDPVGGAGLRRGPGGCPASPTTRPISSSWTCAERSGLDGTFPVGSPGPTSDSGEGLGPAHRGSVAGLGVVRRTIAEQLGTISPGRPRRRPWKLAKEVPR